MDALYGDLENYQFDDIVSELKNENQELKRKLEEYGSTMANLQKDFDKLSGEYKKLELNYSSLLKTARAEIERKSQMITNLNKEKDELVIGVIQRRGRIQNWKNSKGNKQQMRKQLPKEGNFGKKENVAAVPDTIENEVSGTIQHDRNEKYNTPVFSLGPGSMDSNIKQKSKKNDLDKDKEITKNAVKKNKENHLDIDKSGEVKSTDGPILPGSSLKDNLNERDNESKIMKVDECENREKYKSETKKSKQEYLEVSNNGGVASTHQITITPSPPFNDRPDFKENESNFKDFDVYKDEEINKNEIRENKEKRSNLSSNGAIPSSDQKIISLHPSLRDSRKVTENESLSMNIAAHRDRENKYEIKKSKDHLDVFSDKVASSVSKIRNRRKSMPVLNRGDFQISSDEDHDDVCKDYRSRRKTPERHDRIPYNKYFDGRNDIERKVPDLIRMGDRYAANYDSSRGIYRNSYSWYHDSERHKKKGSRDKHEASQRSRKYHSPDSAYIIQEEHHNRYRESYERPQRFDNVRNRILVSPPPEKYKQHRRTRGFEGQGFRNEIVNPIKHKLHDVLEEPVCKRIRSELTDKPPDIHLLRHDRNNEGRAKSMSKQLELSYLSLQSPDYVQLDNHNPDHPVTVIKDTSETKLDDPRLKSKKYIVNTNGNKVVLSTVVGRDIDIKAIDITKWDMNKDKNTHDMPALLRERPQISDDLVKDIYMDIDNPISNLSLESGEICLEDEDTGVVNGNKDSVTVNTVQDFNNKSVTNNVEDHDRNEITKKEPSYKIDNEQQTPTSFLKTYKIAKIKKSDTPKVLEENNAKSTSHKVKKESSKQTHKKRNNKDKRNVQKKSLELNDYNSLNLISDSVDTCKNKKQKLVNIKHTEIPPVKPIISARDTVEGDLELSDETCDYVEDSEQIKYDKGNKVKLGEMCKNIVIDNINADSNVGGTDKSDKFLQNKIERPRENNFNIPYDDHKNQPKESISILNKEQKSKNMKSKLCDLFGESSSLITLDDLGVVQPTTTQNNLNEYNPIFENTQDAVDLNVEDMEKVQTRSVKIQSDKDKDFIKIGKAITSKNKEIADKNYTRKENQKLDVENCSSIPHIFENVNAAPDDKTVVKTVIISSGIQNNCNAEKALSDEKQEIQALTIQKKTNDNTTTSAPALLSIKALATSTPYKPQNEPLSVPEISCKSNSSTLTKDTSNISSNTENNSKVARSNLDIPDVRIIVKRRRKTKAAAP